MAAPGSPAPEPNDFRSLSSVNGQEKAVFIFVFAKLCSLLWCTPTPVLQGKTEGNCFSVLCRIPAQKAVTQPSHGSWFITN